MPQSSTPILRHSHPGKSRRRAPVQPKGRQCDSQSLEEVRALLGERERRRDLLIEYLHLLQDRYRCLRQRHLVALAEELRLPMAEVFEVASFYAHFDLLPDDAPEPAPVTIRVCDSISCQLNGAERLREALAASVGTRARVVRAPCMGRCDTAPVAEVGHRYVDHADPRRVTACLEAEDFEPRIPDYIDLRSYRERGGYALLGECLAGRRTAEEIAGILDEAGLRGLGGAGFPTGRKWRIVAGYPGPRMMCVNADEGEPGTFKDRHYLESDPHRIIEGMLIGAWAVGAERVYLYVRDEYQAALRILRTELAALEAAGLGAHARIELRRGAGAYICGEESAMIESIEGKRGLPRHRPPYVAQVGLFGRPTLEQNVETLYWVRDIVEKGADWFASQGRNGAKGCRSYSVSGRVRDPGVKVAPAGVTVRELIDEYCGGMLEGHQFKAYLPGGASGGVLPAAMGDLPLDFGRLEPHGCFVGSHAVVIFSDQDDMKAVALNLMRFFADESCGQCTPCRVGTEKAVALMEQSRWDAPLLGELAQVMADASICGLGQAAPNPLKSVLKHFPEDCS